MPFSGFDDFSECKRTMMDEEGHDEQAAESICGALQAEAKNEHGDVEELMENIKAGAGLIADVGVDLVSGVDMPAARSSWVAMKSTDAPNGSNYRMESPLLKADSSVSKDEEQRISYAAAMVPREMDKEGDVAPTPVVENAAHDFLTGEGGVDTDHSLIDGEGEVIESWVLKEDRTFDLPGGGAESYPAGTWMVGIKWGADAWDRVKSGDLTGLSIYGMAEHVTLKSTATAKAFEVPFADETVVHVVYESQTAATKASREMGLGGDIHGHDLDGMDVWMPGETHDDFVAAYNADAELPDADGTPAEPVAASTAAESSGEAGETADSPKTAAKGEAGMGSETAEDGEATDLGEQLDSLTEKVESIESSLAETEEKQPDDLQSFLSSQAEKIANHDGFEASPDAVKSALMEVMNADDGEDDDEDDESDMEKGEGADSEAGTESEGVEKGVDDANLEKGGDGRTTAAEKHASTKATAGGSGTPSYDELAADYDGDAA